MNTNRKITISALLVATGIIAGNFIYIPFGPVKAFPIQHGINVVAGVMLGPLYSVIIAFSISLLRILLGTGTIFAFFGSMIGAFFAGMLYKNFRKIKLAVIGEIFGTGIIGSICASLLSILLFGNSSGFFIFLPSFLISSIVGSILGFFILKISHFKNFQSIE